MRALKLLAERLPLWGAQRARSVPKCRGCGACCEFFGGNLAASRTDVKRWQEEGRGDLVAWVGRLGWLWVDPATNSRIGKCPHLVRTGPETAHCAIHGTKPDMCRAYPTLAHGRQCVRGVVFS